MALQSLDIDHGEISNALEDTAFSIKPTYALRYQNLSHVECLRFAMILPQSSVAVANKR